MKTTTPTTTAKPAPSQASKPPAKPAPTKPKLAPKPGRTPKAAPAKPGPKRLSGLDAAAKVLAESKEPLGCAEICERVLKRKLWATKGKTPAATLSSAILREISGKGKASRFRKTGRGLFATNKKA